MRPRINPRIPDNKQIDFLIEWDQVTTEAAISYTKLLLKHWETVLRTSSENIKNIETRINNQGANTEEWKKIKDTIEKVRQQTIEDLEKKQDRDHFRFRTNQLSLKNLRLLQHTHRNHYLKDQEEKIPEEEINCKS